MKKVKLELPPPGALVAHDDDSDPLRYYYHPILGRLYRGRIEAGLALLDASYGRILDVGYGSGIVLPTLCRMAREVVGVDVLSDPESVAARLERIGVQVSLKKADICRWDGEGGKFDLVVAFSVLEHIAQPAVALRRIASLLTPGGVLLIGMPRVDRLMSALFVLMGYSGIQRHHVTAYREVRRSAQPYFQLERMAVFPRPFPSCAGLYFNLLFRKRRAEAAGHREGAAPLTGCST